MKKKVLFFKIPVWSGGYILLQLFLCLSFGLFFKSPLHAEPVDVQSRVILAWTESDGQNDQVFLSQYVNDGWTDPVQLSRSHKIAFQPAVGFGDNGFIWVVWSRLEDSGSSCLVYTVYDTETWSDPIVIDTGMTKNKGVTVIIDKYNIPWIAWEGIQSRYPDIFVSRWNGQRWVTPVKVHPDNNVPDLDPLFVMDDVGEVTLSWQTVLQRHYVSAYRRLDARHWRPLTDSEKKEYRLAKATEKKTFHLPPVTVNDRSKGRLFLRTDSGVFSLPLSGVQ